MGLLSPDSLQGCCRAWGSSARCSQPGRGSAGLIPTRITQPWLRTAHPRLVIPQEHNHAVVTPQPNARHSPRATHRMHTHSRAELQGGDVTPPHGFVAALTDRINPGTSQQAPEASAESPSFPCHPPRTSLLGHLRRHPGRVAAPRQGGSAVFPALKAHVWDLVPILHPHSPPLAQPPSLPCCRERWAWPRCGHAGAGATASASPHPLQGAFLPPPAPLVCSLHVLGIDSAPTTAGDSAD